MPSRKEGTYGTNAETRTPPRAEFGLRVAEESAQGAGPDEPLRPAPVEMMRDVSTVEGGLRSAAARWGLTVGEALTGGSRSAVFAATDGHGRDLVLKLPRRSETDGHPTSAEAAALSAWADTGAAVHLVAASADALLLARVRPGHPLPWQPEGPLSETVGVAGELLRRLWSASPGRFRYPSLPRPTPEASGVLATTPKSSSANAANPREVCPRSDCSQRRARRQSN